MPFTHVVVDGSNIATEGRSIPSLAQLDEAVREFKSEFPHAEITVVVDATFGHRIDPSERATFDDAVAHGEMVSPPAGAIGRGDAFLLRIADRSGATVLSNDSFQEFHGEYDWLFTKDRLIGGKPVPAVGWIFTPRTPVRGPKSRESMREARKSKVRIGSKEASRPMPVPKSPPPRPGSGAEKPRKTGLSEAIAAATEEVVSPEAPGAGRRRRRRGSGPPPEAVNEPLTFIQFIADHPLGSEVEGEVDSFASHGAFVTVGQARCYVPLSAMGDPPPRSAREVMNRGERRPFVLQALDPQRRGIELALPGHVHVSGAPQPETVEAEISGTQPAPAKRTAAKKAAAKTGTAKKAGARRTPAAVAEAGEAVPGTEPTAEAPPARKRTRKIPATVGDVAATPEAGSTAKATKKKTAPARKAAARKVAAEKATAVFPDEGTETAPEPVPAAEKTPAARKAPAKKTAAKKTAAKKTAAKKTAATEATPEVGVVPSGEEVVADPPEARVPAKKTATRKATVAKKSVAKKAPAKKAPAKKAPAKKAPASKSGATKSAASKAPLAEDAQGTAKKLATKKATTKAPAKKAPAKRSAASKSSGDGEPGAL